MKKVTMWLAAVGVIAQLTSAHAVSLSQCYTGNTEGSKAYENVGESLKSALLALSITSSGGSGGQSLDLSELDCLPEYLVIKGGPGFVILSYEDYSALLKDGIVSVADTCLTNPGENPPNISHWEGRGCVQVPEPSTVTASLLAALLLGVPAAKKLRRR